MKNRFNGFPFVVLAKAVETAAGLHGAVDHRAEAAV